jgi:hypothetical protein
LVTVKVYVPGVAAEPPTDFVGVTLNSRFVGESAPFETTVAAAPVKVVPLTVLVSVTVGCAAVVAVSSVVSKPDPVTVSVVAPLPSLREAGAIGPTEAIDGSAYTVKAFATVFDVPLSSVSVTLYVPGATELVDEKFAVAVVVLVASAPPLNVTPVAFVVIVTLPPSCAKPVPENANVPDAPAPKEVPAVCEPPPAVVLTAVTAVRVGAVVAPAVDATANGKAAAINKAPAARAFTPCRGIRRKVFTRNPSFVVFI